MFSAHEFIAMEEEQKGARLRVKGKSCLESELTVVLKEKARAAVEQTGVLTPRGSIVSAMLELKSSPISTRFA